MRQNCTGSKSLYLSLFLSVFSYFPIFSQDFDLIKAQFDDYFISTFDDDNRIELLINTIQNDSTWETVDYASQRPNGWPTTDHLYNIREMCIGYCNPKSKYYKNKTVLKKSLKALEHWIDTDYTNPNWYPQEIRVPKLILTCYILLGEDLPETLITSLQENILKRTKISRHGQNKVWLSGVAFMKGYVLKDELLMEKAASSLWEELKLTNEEGLQRDWSFHQHGPQIQMGTYGIAYLETFVKWLLILRNTKYRPKELQLSLLRNFLIYGLSKPLWKDDYDISSCGRIIPKEMTKKRAESVINSIYHMSKADSKFKREYKKLRNANKTIGHTAFWRSEFSIHRRKNWMATLKMSSTRMLGTEGADFQNALGLHQGDGTLLLYHDGKEYEDIVPFWNWHRLPGTTCDQGLKSLLPLPRRQNYGGTNFSGVLGTKAQGVSAMIYKRDSLKANKTYFFLKDKVICLGAGISGKSNEDVYTSIQQSHLIGNVFSNETLLNEGAFNLNTNITIWHDNFGYQIMGDAICKFGRVEGNWKYAHPSRGDAPETGHTFNLYVNHGQSPKGQQYSYSIYPDVSRSSFAKKIKSNTCKILANTDGYQAIEDKKTLMAVFYKSSSIKTKRFGNISADKSCILIVEKDRLFVSDPTHEHQSIKVTLGNRTFIAKLPQADYRGNKVVVSL